MTIRAIRVVGVLGQVDIPFDFSKSPMFLVGPNGTGKSTALKVVHSILTAQWVRLSDLVFAGCDITVDDEELHFVKSDFSDLNEYINILKRRVRRVKPSETLPESWDAFRQTIGRSFGDRLTQRFDPSQYTSLQKIVNAVDRDSKGKVLYFPTYRRVEKDLSELLESEFELDDDESILTPQIADRFNLTGEVVGFGGQDIELLFLNTARQFTAYARQALNEHSLKFLEAISATGKINTNIARDLIKKPSYIDELIARISTSTDIPINTRVIEIAISALSKKLNERGTGRLTQKDDSLLFYIGEMNKLFNRIDNLSKPLRDFVTIISKYLRPIKTVEFDKINNIAIVRDKFGSEIPLDGLSSGEKQIVAFFAFIFLKSDSGKRYILIDEPELSLSVSWQKSLIDDIQKAAPDAFIVAATHSPFIFDRFGLDSVVSLGDL
jgi:predicted ATP-binding protein involved in virulence